MRNVIGFMCVMGLVAIVGCSDPTADLPEAQVSEPVATSTQADSGAQPAFVETETPEVAATVYTIGGDSVINFEGFKVTGSHVGGFADFAGTVSVAGDDITSAVIDVTIDMRSTYSDDPGLTTKLLSDDFFAAETYPEAAFQSTAIVADGTDFKVTGNLTLHGVTNGVTFPATISVSDAGLVAEAEFTINRFDFGIEYAGVADDLINEKVLILLDIEAAKAD